MVKSFYVIGGTLSGDAPSYVEREADRELHHRLAAGEFCYVLTSRQMGKSSLMIRTAGRLKAEGAAVAVLDLTALGQNLSAEQWYEGLVNLVGQQLGLEDELDDYWVENPSQGPLQRFMRGLREKVLPALGERPLVLFVDEIDAVRSLDFSTDEFFAGIRHCFNQRTSDPALRRLTFCLLGVATPSDLIQDARTTPFNIGHRIELRDFTPAEGQVLAQGLSGGKRQSDKLLERIWYWTGGHPYLTQRLCRSVAAAGVTTPSGVDAACRRLFLSAEAREQDDNLLFVRDRLLRTKLELPALLDLYGRVRKGAWVRPDGTNPLLDELRLSGILRVNGGRLVVRNRIYERVFDRQWVVQHMPDAELRRQRHAYRLGLVRAAAVSGVVLTLMAGLTIQAQTERDRASEAEDEAKTQAARAQQATREARDAKDRAQRARAETEAQKRKVEDEKKKVEAVNTKLEASNAKLGKANRALESTNQQLQLAQSQATNQAQKAERASDRAQQASEMRSEMLYLSQVARAASVTEAGLAMRARDILRQLSPRKGESDHRGWEWRYLWHQTRDVSLRTFQDRHDQPMRTLAISPNSRLVAVPGWRAVEIRRIADGSKVAGFGDLVSDPQSIVFSPTGRLVAISDDELPTLWDLETGKPMGGVPRTGRDVRGLAFSPDGRYLAVAVANPGDARARSLVWDIRRQQAVATGLPPAASVTFSSDGSRVLLAGEKGMVHTLETATWRETERFSTLEPDPFRLALSPDGKTLATTTSSGKVLLWDLSGRTVGGQRFSEILAAHTGAVRSVAFSPDGASLASSGADGTVRLWNVRSGELRGTLHGHQTDVEQVAFSADGKLLASCSKGLLKLWSTVQPNQGELPPAVGTGGSGPISPNRRFVVHPSSQVGALAVTDVLRSRSHTLRAPAGFQAAAASRQPFTRDGQVLYGSIESRERSGGESACAPTPSGVRRVCRWKLRGARPEILKAHEPLGTQLEAVSGDGRLLICAGPERVAVVDSRSGKTLLQQQKVAHWILSPGSRYLLTQGDQNRLWELPSGRPVPLPLPRGIVGFSPDDRLLVYMSRNDVTLWDLRSRRLYLRLRGHEQRVRTWDFSPDGRSLVTGGEDKRVLVWSLDKESRTKLEGHADTVDHIQLEGHTGEVTGVAFSPDGHLVASLGSEPKIRLWRISRTQDRGLEVLSLPAPRNARLHGFGEGGAVLLLEEASRTHRQLRVWRAPQVPELLPAPGRTPVKALPIKVRAARPRPKTRLPNLVPHQGAGVKWTRLWVDEGGGARAHYAQTNRVTTVEISSLGQHPYQVALDLFELPIRTGRYYRVRFRGRADRDRPITVKAQRSDPPHFEIGFEREVDLTRQWRTFDLAFRARETGGRGGFSLSLGCALGRVQLTDLSLVELPSNDGQEPRARVEADLPDRSGGETILPDEKAFAGDQERLPKRPGDATEDQVDLSGYYNALPGITWHFTEGGDNSLSALPTGLQLLRGTLFDVRGVVQLAGEPLSRRRRYPEAVTNIRVQRGCRRIHFLMGAAWGAEDGTVIGQLTLRFANGKSREVPLVHGTNIRDWWDGRPVPEAEVAWEGQNELATTFRSKLRLYKITLENPAPGSVLESFDISSRHTAAAPFLIAVTLE